ncbi:MAG: DUF1294 domain-containing protein [Huintestinicola sp.]
MGGAEMVIRTENIFPAAAAVYFVLISAAAVIVTCRDKHLAKKEGARRIPEKTLFLIAFLGGDIAMYITMKKIRHKTKHKRFMIGIPLIILLHLAMCVCLFIYCKELF